MQKPIFQRLDSLQDISSRDGVRGAVRRMHIFLSGFLQRDQSFKESVVNELHSLYGEFDYTPAAINNGAQAIVTVSVPNLIPGYAVEVSYDQDLSGLQITAYAITDNVKIVLKNDTGAPVTLTAGRFRVYVWARLLSS